MAKLREFITGEQGQGMTEYGLVLSTIAFVVVTIMVQYRQELKGIFDSVANTITSLL